MKTLPWIMMLVVQTMAVPAFSQGKAPGNGNGFTFRYYKPGLYDSLRAPSFRKYGLPWKVPGRINQAYKFNNPDLRFHSAMPTFKPQVRDKMPVVKPDSTVKYHLRIKPIPGGQRYK